jgi:hypothetical protein
VRRLAKASSAGSSSGANGKRAIFGLACLCVLGLAAFLGSGAASAAPANCPNAAIREQQGSTFLPDCRAYEMVSPIEKSGNQAVVDNSGTPLYSRAGVDGNAITYSTTGAMGESFRGLQLFTSGTRTATGWTAKAAIPGPEAGITLSFVRQGPQGALISADASRIAFGSTDTYVLDNPPSPEDNANASSSVYVTSSDGPVEWMGRPSTANPVPQPGNLTINNPTVLTGGSEDFDTIYFSYCGTLTEADAPRTGKSNFGFYVYENGQVSSAGVLPDGSVDPDGATPVASNDFSAGCSNTALQLDPTASGNPVSEDGSQAGFVSPDPMAGSPRPSQLYLHRQGISSVLVSRSELTGLPSITGVRVIGNSYAPASRTGSYLVFASEDRLTAGTPEAPGEKLYRFDAANGDLVYLAGVPAAVQVLAVSDDGSSILFEVYGEREKLLLWNDGENVPVGSFSDDPGTRFHTHVSTDGSTFVFTSDSPFEDGTANHTPGNTAVYRYVVGQSALPNCISCVAPGQPSTGSSYFSNWLMNGASSQPVAGLTLADSRNMTEDGRTVFFDTPSALVPTDTNGKRDVYKWSAGDLSLISTGRSSRHTFILDTSTSTGDVFFATAEGIDPADTDQSYDVYDARVGGGFDRTVLAPCSGEECQPPPGVVPSASPPVSSLLHGPGNAKQRNQVKKKSKKHASKNKKKQHAKKQANKKSKRHASASSSTTVELTAGKN